MIDDVAKAHLHDHLRWEALVWKLGGLSDYDIRRPMTSTGTNLPGLVKHNALSEARYFGEVMGRTHPIDLPPWDEDGGWQATHGRASGAVVLALIYNGISARRSRQSCQPRR